MTNIKLNQINYSVQKMVKNAHEFHDSKLMS